MVASATVHKQKKKTEKEKTEKRRREKERGVLRGKKKCQKKMEKIMKSNIDY